MTTKLRPFTLLFSHHAVLACLCGFLMALTALSGVALAENPVPFINQPLVPDAVAPGGAGFTLTVNGTGFVSGSKVHWNGSALATTFVSASRLTASVPASMIAKASTAWVTVVSPSPGGGASTPAFFAVATPTASVQFGVPSAIGIPAEPYPIVVGDFNGDGKLDLAVGNYGDAIGIFLGNGDGTFQALPQFFPPGAPQGLAVGDFNHDGRLDLVMANGSGVTVLLGNGDGTFQAAVQYAAGTGSVAVAVGDFNGDGNLDLAVANISNGGGSNDVSVFLGNGDGSFQPAVYYSVGLDPHALVVGDFNGDGKLDLAVVNLCVDVSCASGSVSVLLGNGDGTFQAAANYGVGSYPASVVAGDLNGDGKLDLAVANGNYVSILLGNGDGTFQAAVNYDVVAPAWVVLGDFNGDGKLDLAVTNYSSSSVSVLLGNGDGTFQTAVAYGAGVSPDELVVGDFNRDGSLDLAAANSSFGGATTVSVLLQVPAVSLSAASLNFGAQVVATTSPAQVVTLTNTGSALLNISSIAITGTSAADFHLQKNCGSSLAPGSHCTISVTFTPSKIESQSASLTISDNAAGSPQSVSLSGIGVTSGPDVTLSRTSLNFATQVVATSTARSVTLTNYGAVALSIASISITGTDSGDFSETSTCGSSLAILASCTITISFTPTKIGSRMATLSLADNAPGSPQTVTLKGVGTVVAFNPASLSFPRVLLGYSSPAAATTVTNTGIKSLTITGITITGADASDFSQTNNCGPSLSTGASCSVSVIFTPTAAGSRSAAVSVSDNGGGSPQQLSLSGPGVSYCGGACPCAVGCGCVPQCSYHPYHCFNYCKAFAASTTAAGPVACESSENNSFEKLKLP